MRFTPVSEAEAEAQSSGLWPDGTYDYEVKEATEKTSNAGNEMIELQVWLFDKEGGRRMVFDYLTEKAVWKVRQFAASCALLDQYEGGILIANEMVGRQGRCIVGTQKSEGYAPKNVIKSYVKANGGAALTLPRRGVAKTKVPVDDDLDDSIPF
jgi:hypothetical protein